MPHVSPTLEGFRAAFRRPSFTFAEIAWRWAIGATATVLFVFYAIEYLDTLPVSSADALLLSTRQPAFVGQAIQHILRGSLSRAVLAALVAALALSILWVIAASFGRLATVRALLEHFHKNLSDTEATESKTTKAENHERRPIRALLDLNFLRLAVILAMILSFGGAAILGGFVSTVKNPRPGLAFMLFLLLALLVCTVAWALNWWLSLAAVFAVRDGEPALGALSAAVACFRERPGAISAVTTWTGLAHLVAFSVAGTAASFPLALARIAPSRWIVAGILLVSLVYLAVADWLYIVRLAGYVCIAETPEEPTEASADPVLPSPINSVTPESAIDQNEPILSDVPNTPLEA